MSNLNDPKFRTRRDILTNFRVWEGLTIALPLCENSPIDTNWKFHLKDLKFRTRRSILRNVRVWDGLTVGIYNKSPHDKIPRRQNPPCQNPPCQYLPATKSHREKFTCDKIPQILWVPKIENDKIPRDKIPHDKIPHDRIPHDIISRAGPNIRQTRKFLRYYISCVRYNNRLRALLF